MPKDLVILCGGKGLRLKSLTKKFPKPLLKINNIPFLDHLINFYQKYNFNKIYLLAGYKGDQIKKLYDKKSFNFIDIEVIIEKNEMGTGGSLLQLKNKINNDFILINGDSFVDYNFDKFNKLKKNFLGKILMSSEKNYKENKKLIGLKINDKNQIYFSKNSNFFNAGVYYFKKEIFKYITKNSSLENDILPTLINSKKICGLTTNGYFIDIGLPKNLNLAKKNLILQLERPSVFFDRDGVLNHDYGYVHKYSEFRWKKNVLKALKYLTAKNYYIFVITNQAGIGRGYYSEDQFKKLHKKIKSELSKKKIYIDDVVYCPHHPTEAIGVYKKKCQCRKPNNLLIKNIYKKWLINSKKSIMIGDKSSDQACAKKSKIKFLWSKKDLYLQLREKINL
jgi:D,D-heptose 1,7-bisphosphate phosphatase